MKAAGMTETGKLDEDLAKNVKDVNLLAHERAGRRSLRLSGNGTGHAQCHGLLHGLQAFHGRYGKGARKNSPSADPDAQALRHRCANLMRCHESREILNICELAILATMERKESGRCVYRVREFPQSQSRNGQTLLLSRSASGPVFTWGKEYLLWN